MQGFFGKPVDNLFAEPFIARWIRLNVPSWNDAVVVSKNAGGTKRVTSLADTLKLNFGIVTTDWRRPKMAVTTTDTTVYVNSVDQECADEAKEKHPFALKVQRSQGDRSDGSQAEPADYEEDAVRPQTPPGRRPSELDPNREYTDVRVRDVVTGRLVQGQLVDDDYPPAGTSSAPSGERPAHSEPEAPPSMADSIVTNTSSFAPDHALGGTFDAAESTDDEASVGRTAEEEKMITLVGEVRGRTVFIMDDMIDKSGSWVAAAETVVKRGGAKKVYCIATHGLFGNESLEQMEACKSIDHIVVTNTFPIPRQLAKQSEKLIIIDISSLLSESIRRHHYGERYVRADQWDPANDGSVSALFHLND